MVRPVPKPVAAGEVGVLPVQGNIYMLNLGDVNIVAQVGDDGILLVDSGPAAWSDRITQALRDRFGERPLRYLINTEREREPYRRQRRAHEAGASRQRHRQD
jgi:hypothetical protein